MWPQEMTMSSTPCVRSQSSMKAMNGRSTSGTTGLGTVEVSGRSLVPSPPTRITACMEGFSRERQGCHAAASDALVRESGRLDRGGIEGVPAVHDEGPAHARRDV